MLVIRLTRVGKKKAPVYRVVVQEKSRDPWGKSVEIVGHYNPRSNPKEIVFKEERVKYWLSQGAQPSETVHNLLVDAKLLVGSKKRATTKDKAEPKPKEEAKEAPKAQEKPTAEASKATEAPKKEAKEEPKAEEDKPAEEKGE